jgi:hypothetical protein
MVEKRINEDSKSDAVLVGGGGGLRVLKPKFLFKN